MKKVYIAGALNSDAVGYLKNVHTMLFYAEKVKKLNLAIFIPALDLLMGIMFGNWDYKDYFDNSQAWLASSDAVFVCPGSENSLGTQKETAFANDILGIPIFHNLDDLAYWSLLQ